MNTPIDFTAIKLKAEIFKALGHPTRLYILQKLILQKECCVYDFVKDLNLEFSIVSKHLSLLRKASLISARKDGLWKYYSIMVPGIQAFIDNMGDFLDERETVRATMPIEKKTSRKVRKFTKKFKKRA